MGEKDELVDEYLLNVDRIRLDFFKAKFQLFGLDEAQVSLRAYSLYSIILVREFMQTGEDKNQLEKRMRDSVDMFLLDAR